MNPFDIQMMALTALLIILTSFMRFVDKRFTYGIGGVFLTLALIWGDDLCSRSDRMNFYTTHFDKGEEIICKDNNANPILISHSNGWERKGQYLFRNTKGFELLRDSCEIIDHQEPHCISIHWQIAIASVALLWLMGWMALMYKAIENGSKEQRSARDTQEKNNV